MKAAWHWVERIVHWLAIIAVVWIGVMIGKPEEKSGSQRADATYRPANLLEWAKRKNVDPTALQTSVLAEKPTIAAPDP